ncbi:hypothetical protein BDR26DRAFT_920674 [Obelidium mucronatum]|nr:hypothetical protein BDR26DRAFT_920674 [Obelidium mucronatum]
MQFISLATFVAVGVLGQQQIVRSRQIYGADFDQFDLINGGVPGLANVDACIALARSYNGPFFTYDTVSKQCWPKTPKVEPRGDVVTEGFTLPGTDFTNFYDMPAPNPVPSLSRGECLRSCQGRADCAVGVFKPPESQCFLKAPNRYAYAAQFITGFWWLETVSVPVALPETAASPPPPPPPPANDPTAAPPPAAAATSTAAAPPSGSGSQAQTAATRQAALATQAAAQTTPASSPASPGGGGPNVAVIGGAVGGVLLVAIVAGGFVYSRRNPKKSAPDAAEPKSSYTRFDHNDAAPLPAYDSTSSSTHVPMRDLDNLPPNPPTFAAQRPKFVVSAVPGFYRAVRNHTAQNEGQLSIVEGQRLYITSMPNNEGWCKALLGRQEGWVHASMVDVIG